MRAEPLTPGIRLASMAMASAPTDQVDSASGNRVMMPESLFSSILNS